MTTPNYLRNALYILSGEGTGEGHAQLYNGAVTTKAVTQALRAAVAEGGPVERESECRIETVGAWARLAYGEDCGDGQVRLGEVDDVDYAWQHFTLGGRICVMRNRAKLSVPEAAARCGMDRSNWARIERGGRSMEIHTLRMVQQALECSWDELLDGEGC